MDMFFGCFLVHVFTEMFYNRFFFQVAIRQNVGQYLGSTVHLCKVPDILFQWQNAMVDLTILVLPWFSWQFARFDRDWCNGSFKTQFNLKSRWVEMAFFRCRWVCCVCCFWVQIYVLGTVVLGKGSNHILFYRRVFVNTMLFWPLAYYLSQ